MVIPFGTPVPPSPATSDAILAAFAERGIEFIAGHRVAALDPDTGDAVLDDGTRLPFDLFLGIPVHRAPSVVVDAGMTEDGWIPVDPPPSPRGSRASTPWATSRASARRRRGCSPSAPPASWPIS